MWGDGPAALSLINARSLTLRDQYFVGVVPLAVITTIASGLAWRWCRDEKIRACCLFMFVAFAIHLGYRVFISNGWPRYAFNGILFACAIAPILILGAKASTATLTALTIIIATLTGGAGLNWYVGMWLKPAFLWSRHDSQLQLDVVKFLDEERHSGPVYAPNWAHVASLEYLKKSTWPVLRDHRRVQCSGLIGHSSPIAASRQSGICDVSRSLSAVAHFRAGLRNPDVHSRRRMEAPEVTS